MSNLYLENLKNNRDEVLKAEIVSLFTLLEKTFTEWWKEKGYFQNYSPVYNNIPHKIENLLNELKNINIKLKIKNSAKNDINAWEDFINKWREWRRISLNNTPEKFLQVLYGGCEGINSGIEKGSPKEQIKGDQPFLSTSYGTLKKIIDDSKLNKLREILFKEKIINKVDELEKILEIHFGKFSKNIIKFNFQDLLNQLSISSFKKLITIRIRIYNLICLLYSNIPSDTRFPANDTSLFDQSYMSSSLFKAALSGIILESQKVNSKLEIDISTFDQSKIKWSILGLQYDKLALSEKGLKAASIKWYRETSDKVDNEIKKIMEVEYPIGNEVYRDETGIYFVVSENLIGDKSGDFYKLSSELDEIKNKIYGIFKNNFQGEVYPSIFLTEPSRGLMSLGHLIEKAKDNFLKVEIPDDFVNNLRSQYDSNPEGICQICKLRLAIKNKKDDLICDVCKGRMEERNKNKDWRNGGETIWLDELQGKKGRVALITLKFELDRWISGNLVNSLVVQNFDLTNKKYNDYLNAVIDGIKNNKKLNNTLLKDYHINIPNLSLRQIAEKWFLERSIGSKWEEFIKSKLGSKIDFENRNIQWQSLTDSDMHFLSELILQFLLRKNPSPARLRRIWETTREFFEDLERKIVELSGIKIEMQKRLVWNNVKIPDGEYQDGDILFYAKDNTVYLISSIEKIGDKKEFKLKKYGEENSQIVAGLQKVDSIEQAYKPFFTILSPTPISWQFIIHAENVPKLIKNIQEEYYKNFRWVYGKLPLHIGVIIQNYKKPLYIGIKALRKIRRDNTNWFNLRNEISAKEFKARQKKALDNQQIPEQVSDCEAFYSLFEKVNGEGRYEFYLYPDKEEKQKIDTIKEPIDTTQNSPYTERFYFYPNTFDFEFLDTNTRRNNIFYKKARRFLKLKQNRPYDIEEWQYFEEFKKYFSDKKSSSKLQKLISLIYSKLEDWDVWENPENALHFRNFMISSFINILELKDEAKKNEFSAILGLNDFNSFKSLSFEEFKEKILMLIDMFDFWHTSLKFENKEGGKNE